MIFTFIFNKGRAPTFQLDSALAAALLLSLAGVALRLLAVPEQVGDVDAVNLARGLHHYDLFAQAPHAPGYPVLIAAARCVRALGVQRESWALALPGILLWLPASVAAFVGLRRRVQVWPALGVVAITSLAPGIVVASAWPGSEGLGIALLMLAVGLAAFDGNRAAFGSALTLGLLLGTRLSWWPVAVALSVALLWQRRARLGTLSLGLGSGTALWLGPMLLLFSPQRLWGLVWSFGKGHLFSWGGTALDASHPSFGSRVLRASWGIWDAGLGAAWPAVAPGSTELGEMQLAAWGVALVVVVALARLALAPSTRRWAAGVALLSLPYLAWLLGFQNLEKPRHLLPLLPALGALIGVGIAELRQRSVVALGGVAALLVVCAPRAWAQGRHPVPAVALVGKLTSEYRPEGLLVFAGQEARVLEHYAPMYRVVRPADGDVLLEEAERVSQLGVDVLVTSSAAGFSRVSARTTPLESFHFDRSVRPQDRFLSLNRLAPAPSQRLAQQLARRSP